MAATVAHTRDYRGHGPTAYIGRPSLYGNPHPLGRTCPICRVWHTREQAIARFRRDWYSDRYAGIREQAARELRDHVLLCFCKPNDCHGDVIAEWLNNLPSA